MEELALTNEQTLPILTGEKEVSDGLRTHGKVMLVMLVGVCGNSVLRASLSSVK